MTKGVASWGWSTVPQKHLNGRVIWYTQAKVIGGGSSINAQLYTRGNAKDYDAWASDAGCKGWSYREVLPYFIRSEDNQRLVNAYHGYGGPLGVSYPVNPPPISFAFLRAAQEAGIPFNADFNGAVQDGIGHYQLSTRERGAVVRRERLPEAGAEPHEPHGAAARRRRSKIEIENGRAVGVDRRSGERNRDPARRPGGHRQLRGDRIAAAASALGRRPGGRAEVRGRAGRARSSGRRRQYAGPSRSLRDLRMHRRSHLRPRRAAAPHDMGGARSISCSRPDPSPRPRSRPAASGTRTSRRALRTSSSISGSDPGSRPGVAQMKNPGVTLNSAFLRPRSRGTVRLAERGSESRAADRPQLLGRPLRSRMRAKGLRLAREILRQPALKPFVLGRAAAGRQSESDEELAEYAYRSCKTDHHPAGTCAMGTAGPKPS